MPKVITDEKMIEEVLTRGVEKVLPSYDLLKKILSSGKKIRLYCGFDPTAPSLHIGNAIQINKLAQFQRLGHEVIFLIGDFTGMIGDPTDKSAARKKLTRAEVKKNCKNYKKQASAFLKFSGANAAKVMYNSKWSDKLNFRDLIELSSNFTVQQMIQRDMFQKRIEEEKPIYVHEFFYPIAQAYDSVVMDVDLEIGGNDQLFNIMCGRDLMKALKNKEKFVVTTKLLADDNGKKMGKSEGNAVFIDQAPENIYGTVMSWPDGAIYSGFELCSLTKMAELPMIKKSLDEGANPRDLKMRLAKEITTIFSGEKNAIKAEEHFVKTIQKKEMPDEIKTIELKSGERKLADLLFEINIVSSKGEAKRLIAQKGIKINNKEAENAEEIIQIGQGEIIIQRGKRQFIKIK